MSDFSPLSTVRSMTLVNVEFLYRARSVEHFCTHLYKCHPHFKQYQCTVIVRCCYLLCVVSEQILYNHRELVYALKSCHPCLCLRFWLFVCIYCHVYKSRLDRFQTLRWLHLLKFILCTEFKAGESKYVKPSWQKFS